MNHLPAYEHLIRKEADHWSAVHTDPSNPQIWHDEEMFRIFFGSHFSNFLETILRHGPRILELGCGEGSLAIALAQHGCSVTAIDISEARIARAQQRATEAGVAQSVEFRVADLNRIELPAGRYTCAVAHDSLHHVFDLDHLLQQVSVSLLGEGALVVMDYQGMGRIRKLLAAGLYGALPTHQSYRHKWGLRTRLRGFLTTEHARRNAAAHGDLGPLHPDSPFEEISQTSIIPVIGRHFTVHRQLSFLPFWFYLAPKIRLPRQIRYPCARVMKRMDDILRSVGIPGAYFFLEARQQDHAPAPH